LKGDHPGPLSNEIFYSAEDKRKFNRSIREDIDYIWLPDFAGDLLWKAYGGDPVLRRRAFSSDGELRLSLNKYRMNVYHCDKANKHPVVTLLTRIAHSFNGDFSLQKAIEYLRMKLQISEGSSTRIWVRKVPCNVCNIFRDRRIFYPERYLTADYVNWDEDGF
jgi:hypothetical protein